MREAEFRNKVTWFVFFYSLLVIWTHSYNSELFLGKTAGAAQLDRIQHVFGQTVGQIAVPGFFLISAYLFYRNFDWDRLGRKWLSRGRSVFVPYVVWTTIYYLGYVIGSRLPFVRNIIGKGTIPLSASAWADAVLHHRYLYVFWYLKQLMILILLAPVFYFLLKRVKAGFVLLLFLFWVVWRYVDFPYVNEDAMVYYGVGGYLAIHGRQLEAAWNKRRAALGMGICLLGTGSLLLGTVYANAAATVAYRLFVPVGLWLLVDEKRLPQARAWMENNFFLYVVHFAFVRLLNKCSAKVFAPSFVLPLVLYLAMPAVLTVLSYLLALVIKKYTPKIWSVLNGGR